MYSLPTIHRCHGCDRAGTVLVEGRVSSELSAADGRVWSMGGTIHSTGINTGV